MHLLIRVDTGNNEHYAQRYNEVEEFRKSWLTRKTCRVQFQVRRKVGEGREEGPEPTQ